MKTLFIEIDGVMANLLDAIKALSDPAAPSLQMADIKDDEAWADLNVQRHRDFFLKLRFLPFAKASVSELAKHFRIYWIVKPVRKMPQSYADKVDWVTGHFGQAAAKNVILTWQPHLITGDYLLTAQPLTDVTAFHHVIAHTTWPGTLREIEKHEGISLFEPIMAQLYYKD